MKRYVCDFVAFAPEDAAIENAALQGHYKKEALQERALRFRGLRAKTQCV